MPTVLRLGAYRFAFYSSDSAEPEHVHVKRAGSEAKFWLNPVRLEWTWGFSQRELTVVERLVAEHRGVLMEAWRDYFQD
jgi:hypothetical protein